ncbi:hypothetical protein NZK35_04055 [Stieleria sp. ICT_E10.1]|uniref:Uncharacterized protein n=1 Tax=Stieleria magnilauensis TaxID=2527963 RepID=A0ABX5XW23_9BACT|nr:hypothetical protein [Stieleria sedimenti]MCS7465848.1 hypothetical protein [Stieleria sedimenti]QDV86235.1 hypothetical protein TBK1r_52540 [Planctomycetes bacterium TBK1r]
MNSMILNVFPSDSGDQRLVLARESDGDGSSTLVLRQESRSPHVGWFVQSRIAIEPNQVAALKMTLTSNLVKEALPADETPAVLSFRSAMAG